MGTVRTTAYHYCLHLTKGQQRLLEQQLEECRWLYNQTLALRHDAWQQRQETLRLYDTQALLPEWKAERKTLKLVHSQVLQNVQVRVDLAFKAFFRRVKAGEQDAGYPRFRGFGRYDSMTYPQYGNGARLEGNRLILSKIGALLLTLHRPVEGRIKTVTLRRSSTGKWFVAFAVERERSQVAEGKEAAVGVDVGLEKFATLSTGEMIDNPRFTVFVSPLEGPYMSLPQPTDWIIPAQTGRVAYAAFPKGSAVMCLRDELDVLYDDQVYAALFASRSQPAVSPGSLRLPYHD